MSDKLDAKNCKEFNKCMEILQLMLDNEASKEEQKYVSEHIHQCLVCFEQYELEKEIRELIKKKCSNLPVPDGLAAQIRTQIQSIQNQ
jgi:anti-sigma factor (TIGR02949 family)